MGEYLLNKETQKIELHFDKSEYVGLSEELKKEIKSAFLWSNRAKAWVSRSKNNHYYPIKIAKKLGLENVGEVGERLSYEEELERKSERAEARAERYEQYSENAEGKAKNLQSDFNKYREDWAWLTQPVIAGHSGSKSFQNYRNRVMARYEKGFEEYEKSKYYQQKAAIARETANNEKLKDKVYLYNRIKECNKNLKNYQKQIVAYEDNIYKLQNGEVLKDWNGSLLTIERQEKSIADVLEKYDYEYNKLEFFEKCMSELGGVQFSKDNIKVGYIVNIKEYTGKCEVVSVGSKNIKYKILEGGAKGMILTVPYAAIESILQAKEDIEKIENPYKVGDILCAYRPADDSVYQAFQVVKVTKTGVKLQQIKIEDGKPIKDEFVSDKQLQKKVVKSKYSDFVGIYYNNWQLHKYNK